jgi:hypothetical protein
MLPPPNCPIPDQPPFAVADAEASPVPLVLATLRALASPPPPPIA